MMRRPSISPLLSPGRLSKHGGPIRWVSGFAGLGLKAVRLRSLWTRSEADEVPVLYSLQKSAAGLGEILQVYSLEILQDKTDNTYL